MNLITALERRFPGRIHRIDPTAWDRIYVVGNVHGCSTELYELLDGLGVGAVDLVICVGDVVGKGPDSMGVLKIVLDRENVLGVLGDADAAAARDAAGLPGELRTRLMEWPLAIAWDDNVVIHAGIDPRRPIAAHEPKDLLKTRSLRHGSAYKSPYWFELYRGDTRIFFGHT